ncbi:hypothetical protein [Pseudomonas aeruginosa]|uniref:hypothetical protein n=1 Tax=Pseudomonas aeruginosa TaxID=287 RepID=UPI0020A68D0E|nr:hypothetical protein [Pseudomonas aeruginosa]
MSSTQHQLIEQCAIRLRGIVEALDNIHDSTQHRSPHRWSTDLDDVHSSAESLLALIKDQAPARSEASFEEWLANELEGEDGQPVPAAVCDIALARRAFNHWPKLEQPAKVGGVRFSAGVSSRLVVEAAQRLNEFESTPEQEAERPEMSPERAAYFMRRFKSEEKLLGPNEQAAVDYVLSLLAQHESIVGALRAELESERNRVNIYVNNNGIRQDNERLRAELRAALARVAELEGKLTDWVHEGFRLNEALAVAKAQHSVPEVSGIGRDTGHPRAVVLYLSKAPTDDDLRAIHDALRSLAAAPGNSVPQAWLDVQAERRRQITAEGWTPEHDDEHSHGQIARAAACYALAGSSAPNDGTAALLVSLAWPWDEQWWKPSTARRDMVKACALGLAEIERLDRAAATQGGPRDA